MEPPGHKETKKSKGATAGMSCLGARVVCHSFQIPFALSLRFG
jgi:hypothetical protein